LKEDEIENKIKFEKSIKKIEKKGWNQKKNNLKGWFANLEGHAWISKRQEKRGGGGEKRGGGGEEKVISMASELYWTHALHKEEKKVGMNWMAWRRYFLLPEPAVLRQLFIKIPHCS